MTLEEAGIDDLARALHDRVVALRSLVQERNEKGNSLALMIYSVVEVACGLFIVYYHDPDEPDDRPGLIQ